MPAKMFGYKRIIQKLSNTFRKKLLEIIKTQGLSNLRTLLKTLILSSRTKSIKENRILPQF